MNWRPKDWKNPHHITVDSSGRPFRYNHDAYEGGADAMLPAVCWEIGKSLLTDEEIRAANPDECVCGISDARAMCQAQLGKILAMLQKEV